MSKQKYEVVSKTINHGEWYQSILIASDMIDYTDISGCYVLKPWSYEMWEVLKQNLDKSIKKLDIENYYFPLFCTKTNLEKESSHFNDFVIEAAWIETKDKYNKDLETEELIAKLKEKGLDVNVKNKDAEKYAIRPTSETIIYPHFTNWIKSGKYPKINQWANVVRWENKTTQPFIRTKEFLWQEGHTCHPTKQLAIQEVYTVLELYKTLYEDILAVPIIDGCKTKNETFPGAELTTTIEGFLPDSGKGIQAATSHYLGQKFAKIFDIKNSNGEYVYQNSWGFTTRSIGIMVMTHSDDRGLNLPPKIAPIQVILIACGLTNKRTKEEKQKVIDTLSKLENMLNQNGIRAKFDNDRSETPGMKFNKWEVKGVPLRIEYGPIDIENNTISFFRRDTRVKEQFHFTQVCCNPDFINNYLQNIQQNMFQNAFNMLKNNIVYCNNKIDIVNALKNKKLTLIDFIDDLNYEEDLKKFCELNGVKSTKVLCIPNMNTINKFINIDKEKKIALFGRSY
jgi:prolyl-tRNA synthetase family I